MTKVEVDPDRVLLLDLNYTNNSWSAQPRAPEAATKWALRWLTWVAGTAADLCLLRLNSPAACVRARPVLGAFLEGWRRVLRAPR